MAIININTDEVVAYTNRLERLHRSDLPIAIRNALTKAARLTKTKTLLKATKQAFTNRNKGFFKAKSKFLPAQGFSISGMKATVGMSDIRDGGSNDHAVRDLKEQEHGGLISGRSFVPVVGGKLGKDRIGKVRSDNRINKTNIKNIVRTKSVRARGKQKWIRAVIFAKKRFGTNALVLGNRKVFRIDSISSGIKTRKMRIKKTWIATFRKGRSVRIKPTNFMRKASMINAKRMDILYIEEAKKRIKRAS